MKGKISIIYANNNVDPYFYYPPLGGLYITSFLKHKGIDASYYDFTIIGKWRKKIHEIIDSNPDVIGLSSNVSNYFNTHFLARYIKSFNKDIKIIVGGPYPTSVPEKYLRNKAIDAVCIGEGEYTFYNYLVEGDKANGLMVKKNGEFFLTDPALCIQNLDDLPFPDLTQVDLRKYFHPFQKGKPMSSIITSRGCPSNCTFCFHDVHGYDWRARSPKNVIEEIKWQVREFGVGELAFWDDNFTLDEKRAEKICDLLIQEKTNIPLFPPNGIRADRVNRGLLSKMKQAGFWLMVFSPETGDPSILSRIKKGFTLKQIEKVARWSKALGFFLIFYFLIGFPFETKENVQNTLNFIKRVKPDIFLINRYYPMPKTPIAEEYNLTTDEGRDFKTVKLSKGFSKLIYSAYFNFYFNPFNLWNLLKQVDKRNFFLSFFRYFKAAINNLGRKFDYSLSD
ncbi:MAG: cobalamin B12-binding domain-containing protein [Candidatus Helarchaeota archaeon]|nr:cobalamin B12-binding domain-containing protein [Candidatus Helarchaeota archaeon]